MITLTLIITIGEDEKMEVAMDVNKKDPTNYEIECGHIIAEAVHQALKANTEGLTVTKPQRN